MITIKKAKCSICKKAKSKEEMYYVVNQKTNKFDWVCAYCLVEE